MKVKGAKKVHYDSGPNMTPLVDVVMVILIFLMLAGSFGGAAHFLVSKQGIKATGGHGRPLKPGEIPDVNLEVARRQLPRRRGIRRPGDWNNADRQCRNSFRAALDAKTQKHETLPATPTDQIQVVLYPGRRVKYRFLIQTYQAAMNAKFEKIAFADFTLTARTLLSIVRVGSSTRRGVRRCDLRHGGTPNETSPYVSAPHYDFRPQSDARSST